MNYDKNQYNRISEEFAVAQKSYYGKNTDESREVLYSFLDFPLKNKKILDVGCGFGKDILYYREKGAIVSGIDISKKMIETASRNSGIKELSVQDYSKTNFRDAQFDVLVARYSLQYAKDLDGVFKEMHRILKKNGCFVFLNAHPLLGFVAKKKRIISNKK